MHGCVTTGVTCTTGWDCTVAAAAGVIVIWTGFPLAVAWMGVAETVRVVRVTGVCEMEGWVMREIVGADWVTDDPAVVLIRREVADPARLVGVA